jgi:dolichyl-phosphate-mannose--protein O-mannosyl transferase
MDKIFEHLPEIIGAAAQSLLGTFALLSVVLSVLAYFFFAKAREKVKVVIFVLLFLGVVGFAIAMFRVSAGVSITTQSIPSKTELSKEAMILLKGAAADQSGLVLFERYGASVDLHTNGQTLFTDKANHQELATWEAALQELVTEGLFIDRGDNGEIYEITKKGYDVAKN